MKGEEMSVIKKWLIVLIIILAIASMTFMSGCDGGPEELLQTKDGANDLADLGLSKDDIVPPPDGWPSDVPISKDILIYLSGGNSGENKNWNITGMYKYSAADMYNFYKSALSGWTIILDDGPKDDILEKEPATIQLYYVRNDKYGVEIGIFDVKSHIITIYVYELEESNK